MEERIAILEDIITIFGEDAAWRYEDILWLYDDEACVSFLDDDLTIAFNLITQPDVAAIIIQRLQLNGVDPIILECYYFDELGELKFESEKRWEGRLN